MIIPHLRRAVRSLFAHKTYALTNILGLSVGLAGAFFIFIYIVNQTSYDRHQANSRKIFRVICLNHSFGWKQPLTPFALAGNLRDEFPEVKTAAAIRGLWNVEFQKGQELIGERGVYSTEPEILDILAFNITHGNKDNALGDLNEIIISEGLAKKYFNTTDPIGEQLIASINGKQVALTVKAVFQDYPRLSTFKPQALIHSQYAIDDLQRSFEGDDVKNSYLLGFHTTYVFF